jgi:glutaminyl-tRNA synthetase
VLSKRLIKPLVEAKVVSGWDDPRLATVAAYRRRGIPAEAIRLLTKMVGVSKSGARTEEAKLDFAIRESLNVSAPRVLAVLEPLKVVLTNYPEGKHEEFDAPYFPPDVGLEGSRAVPFSRELWIERSDFEEKPPKGFRRLVPGGEVRLRYAYVIRCDEVVKDEQGNVVELRCTYDPETKSGAAGDDRKVKGTIQWVAADSALSAEVRIFERLFDGGSDEELDEKTVVDRVNADSLVVIEDAKVEPSVAGDAPERRYQFERTGYFWRDPVDGVGDRLVFNRIVALKDTWTRKEPVPVEAPRKRSSAPQPATVSAPPRRRSKPRATAAKPGAGLEDPRRDAKLERYRGELGVSDELAEVLAESAPWGDFFEAALAEYDDAAALAVWIVNDLRGLLGNRSLDDLSFGGTELGSLAALVDRGEVTRRAAKDVLARMVEEGGDPADLIAQMGLTKVADPDELGEVIDAVLAAWPDKVIEYRSGKKGLIGLFVGEVMKKTGGAADPATAKSILAARLEG